MEACCLVSIHAPFQRVISNSKASDNNTRGFASFKTVEDYKARTGDLRG
jgi:hypothetical protein